MLDIHLGADRGTAGEIPLGDVDVDAIFLPLAVEPVIAPVAHVRVPVLEQLAVQIPLLPHHSRLEKPIAATPIQEADLRIEVPPDLNDAREVAPGTRLVAEPRAVRLRVAVGAGRGGGGAPPVDRPGIANADAPVHAGDAIPVSRVRRRRALHGDHANVRAGGALPLE